MAPAAQILSRSSSILLRDASGAWVARVAAAAAFSTSAGRFVPKFCATAEDAVKDIPNGAKLLVGGK
jgi:hypothetical protein